MPPFHWKHVNSAKYRIAIPSKTVTGYGSSAVSAVRSPVQTSIIISGSQKLDLVHIHIISTSKHIKKYIYKQITHCKCYWSIADWSLVYGINDFLKRLVRACLQMTRHESAGYGMSVVPRHSDQEPGGRQTQHGVGLLLLQISRCRPANSIGLFTKCLI